MTTITQPTIWDRPVARATDPTTSWQAARSISKDRLRESQQEVLEILTKHGPLTDEGILYYTSQSPSGARTRRAELVALGFVRDSGRRELTKAGRHTIVWEARL